MKIKDIRLFGSDESSPSPWLTLNRIFISYTPLLGAITDDVRAVAIKWNEKDKYLLLRYYFSSFPSDEDKKMVSDALAEIVSHACFEIKRAESECIHSLGPVKELDQLDGWLHLKKENATGTQANFERLEIIEGKPRVIGNGHLDIKQ